MLTKQKPAPAVSDLRPIKARVAGQQHVSDNLPAAELTLDAENPAALDADFAPPTRRTRLAML